MSRKLATFIMVVLTSWMILGTHETYAQQVVSKFGKDSAKCVTNLALYREYYRLKHYRDALSSWRYVFNNCPKATENIFINGANMFNSFIATEKDSAVKKRLIDTLLLIYNTRIKYYGNEGKHLANMANDLLNADTSRSFEAYGMLKRSIDLLKNNSEESTLRNYSSAGIACYKAGIISNDELINLFNQTESVIDSHLGSNVGNADSQKWVKFRTLFELNLFPLMQCKDISSIFSTKLAAKPDDLDLLKRVTEILFHRGCTDDSLYLSSLEKMNTLEPDPNTAFLISREYLKRKNNVSAVEVLSNVADKLKDINAKARCYYYLGVVYAETKDYSNARTNALKAIELKADYGEPYLLIADCYVQSAMECGKDNISIRAPYWCAVDKLNQAKKADPKLTSTINTLINQYSSNFPTKAMLAVGKLKIGSNYQVGCWINETTVVRSNTEIRK